MRLLRASLLASLAWLGASTARAGAVEIRFGGTINYLADGTTFLPVPPSLGDSFSGDLLVDPSTFAGFEQFGLATYTGQASAPIQFSFAGLSLSTEVFFQVEDSSSGLDCGDGCDFWALDFTGRDPSAPGAFFGFRVSLEDPTGMRLENNDLFIPTSVDGWSNVVFRTSYLRDDESLYVARDVEGTVDYWSVSAVPEPGGIVWVALLLATGLAATRRTLLS